MISIAATSKSRDDVGLTYDTTDRLDRSFSSIQREERGARFVFWHLNDAL
jgi:hypothetical protein